MPRQPGSCPASAGKSPPPRRWTPRYTGSSWRPRPLRAPVRPRIRGRASRCSPRARGRSRGPPAIPREPRREVRAPFDPEKVEDVDIVRTQLPQAPLQRAPQVLMPPDQVIGAGGQDVLLAPRRNGFPQHARHVPVEAEIQEIVETLIQRLEDGFPPGTVGRRKADPADRRTDLAERHAQEVRRHLFPV